jgi:hypothetical protein
VMKGSKQRMDSPQCTTLPPLPGTTVERSEPLRKLDSKTKVLASFILSTASSATVMQHLIHLYASTSRWLTGGNPHGKASVLVKRDQLILFNHHEISCIKNRGLSMQAAFAARTRQSPRSQTKNPDVLASLMSVISAIHRKRP